MFVDGVNFDRRMDDTIEKIPVLVVIGVNGTGQRLVLGLQAGDKESASNWRETSPMNTPTWQLSILPR
jgi:putative transposase